ncbi:MAG: hypothetical protein HRT44_11485 [Bdellovibrionales bacterium]|nr:hypothetical protein [Bdellovibrionales bacterium]NQZ19864.1 hypothetical protein [Bdellovibrionales bacterium]
MKALIYISILILSFSAMAESIYDIERVENPCFQRQESESQKQACEICSETARRESVSVCRSQREAADALFDDVIYAETEDYARIYRQWRELVNLRDQCRVDILKSCLDQQL